VYFVLSKINIYIFVCKHYKLMTINLSNIKHSRIYILIFVLTFVIYGNGINNEYALDDNIVVDSNKMVEEGFKALPTIFKSRYANDAKQQYDYRPLVIASFAIEKQFFKKLPVAQTKEDKKRKDKLTQANISHFINVLLYAISCILIFQVLLKLFDSNNILLPLIVTLIYLVHPLHTEVVDNIKSRDELMMFLFMLISIKYFFKYADTSKLKYIIIAPIFVFLSVLSKKNGIALVGILPVLMYFKSYNYKKILISCSTFIVLYGLFVLMKKGLVSTETVRNLKYFENPLIFEGTIIDRITVGLYCSFFYLKMLIFPVDLSFYYGYNQIPMATFKNWEVWVAILFYIPLAVYGIIQTYKRQVIGLGILLWLGTMLMVINVLFPIVGIVADRFSYMFSLGFCITVGFLLFKVFKIDLSSENTKINLPGSFSAVLMGILIVYSGRTIARNPDWHDYLHLYTTDIQHLEESAKAHALIANTMYPQVITLFKKNPTNPALGSEINKLVFHFKEAVRIDSTYATSLNNLGSVYLNFYRDYPSAIKYCEKAIVYDTNYVEARYNSAFSHNAIGNYDQSIAHIKKVVEFNPDYLKIYDLLNGILKENNKIDEGIVIMENIAVNSEAPKNIYLNMGNLVSSKGEGSYGEALQYFVKAFEYDNNDKALCNHIIKLSYRLGRNDLIKQYSAICN
jgi:protein O-mannosyl-transferase